VHYITYYTLTEKNIGLFIIVFISNYTLHCFAQGSSGQTLTFCFFSFLEVGNGLSPNYY